MGKKEKYTKEELVGKAVEMVREKDSTISAYALLRISPAFRLSRFAAISAI